MPRPLGLPTSAILVLWILMGVRLLGSVMRRYEIPLASVLIAFILGLSAETELRRALTVSEGDLGILMSSSITVALYSVLVITLVFTAWKHIRSRKQAEVESASVGELTSV